MEDARFQRIVDSHGKMLTALMSPFVGTLGGERIYYNAYIGGTEVCVVGYRMTEDDGSVSTKPIAILVDEELFRAMRVDHERGRHILGEDLPPLVQ